MNFGYPEPSSDLGGELIDRFPIKVSENDDVVYWFVMDQIHFEGKTENWIRLTYYRYRKPEIKRGWNFAGQTSITGPGSQLKRFFVEEIKAKPWIRAFFQEVLDECEDQFY